MARHLIVRPVCAVAIAGVATIVGLAGCSGASSSTAASSPAVTPAPSQHTTAQPTASSQPTVVPVEPLKKSKLFFLTRISRAQLCGLLHGSEPSKILRSSAGPATFANTLGLGVVCTWSQSAGSGELYIGISTLFPWRGAKPIDKFSGDKPTTVDGHPADAGPPNSRISYATVHVATAGLNDPVVEFRAPTLAAALKLAQLVVPRLLAITHAG
jgi:hypothetical protein